MLNRNEQKMREAARARERSRSYPSYNNHEGYRYGKSPRSVDLMGFKTDWLSFTKKVENSQNPELTIKKIFDYLGYDLDLFEDVPPQNFYNSGISLGGGFVKVFYNTSDKPTHKNSSDTADFIFTGQGCTDLNDKLKVLNSSDNYEMNWVNFLDYLVTDGVNFTRIDLALDDYDPTDGVNFDLIIKKLDAGEYRSSKQTYRVVKGATAKGKIDGLTIYIGKNVGGSKGSSMLRMYDKWAQYQSEKLLPPAAARKTGTWKRFEMTYTKTKARAIIFKIIEDGFGEAYYGTLRDTVEFLVPTKNNSGEIHQNKSRWRVCKWWEDFLQKAERVKLSDFERDLTLVKTLAWIRNSVAPSLKLLERIGDERGFDIYELIRRLDEPEYSKKQQRMLLNTKTIPDKQLMLYIRRFEEGEL